MNWIEEFVASMFPLDVSQMKIEQGFQLKFSHLPKRIFKYRSCNSNSFRNLQEDTIWLADPNTFNDPYDCHHFINFQKLAGLITRELPPEIRSQLPADKISLIEKNIVEVEDPLDLLVDAAFEDVDPKMQVAMKAMLRTVLEKQYEEMAKAGDKIKDGFRLCSFSERKDSTLMWAHYASDHRGFCIEYDIRSLPSDDFTSRFMYPVIYQEEVFDATECMILAKTKKFNNLYLNQAALIKGKDWSYEKEWRLVFANGLLAEPRAWKMPTPKAVYFGSHISPEDEATLKEICIGKEISMFKMQHSRSRYIMSAEPI